MGLTVGRALRCAYLLAIVPLGTLVVFACSSSVEGSMDGPVEEDGGIDVAAPDTSAPTDDDAGTDDAGLDADDDVSEPCPDGGLRVFVTSQQYDGDLGGRAGGDGRCKTLADNAGLEPSATWVAWLSADAVNAIDLLPQTGSWCLVDRSAFVGSRNDLVKGTLKHSINKTQTGAIAAESSGAKAAWTGTLANGLAGPNNCSNWTKAGILFVGGRGNYGSKTAEWTHWPPPGAVPAVTCNNTNRLYCFETN